MAHILWTTKDWKNATEEQVLSALFNLPDKTPPEDAAQIKRLFPGIQAKFLGLARLEKSIKKNLFDIKSIQI